MEIIDMERNVETKKRDADRDAILIEEGFRILHIRERDYKADPIKTVKDCVEFLNG